jgi:flagellar biogenesis protein FliO
MEWIVVKTFLSLAAVLALMVAVVFVMKKYVHGGQARSRNIVDMNVIGTMMLQPKRSVSLLKVMNKVLIIGVTEDGMETLGEISDEKCLQQIEEQLAAQPAQTAWFAKKNEKARTEGEKISFAEALSLQVSKLMAKGSR